MSSNLTLTAIVFNGLASCLFSINALASQRGAKKVISWSSLTFTCLNALSWQHSDIQCPESNGSALTIAYHRESDDCAVCMWC